MIIKSKSYKKICAFNDFGWCFRVMFLIEFIYKAVPDFIDFHIGNFHWFIFNVSDIFITLGVILMIFFEIIGKAKITQ